MTLSACASGEQTLKAPQPSRVNPQLSASHFISFDGAKLGLTVWRPAGDVLGVVIGVHGMNDYANAFHRAAPIWAEYGLVTYAYDQRGFGRSPERGIWPNEDVMRQDLRQAIALARRAHPRLPISVAGISMGGAVAMTAAAELQGLDCDRLVLLAPGLRGWGALPSLWSVSLWLSTLLRPNWVVRPPRGIKIYPTDNFEMLRAHSLDPLTLKTNRIDAVRGVVALMEHAHAAAQHLPAKTFVAYGANDQVIPEQAMARSAVLFPTHVRTAYYPQGYHMLTRDLNGDLVSHDAACFMVNPTTKLPSGAGPLPWTSS